MIAEDFMRISKRILCAVVCIAIACLFVPLVGCGFDSTVSKAAKKLNNYSIEASLDDESKTIVATEKFEAKFNEDRNELWFNLYGRAFRENAKILPYAETSKAKCFPLGENFGSLEIESVKLNKQDAAFSYGGEDENVLIVACNAKKGQKVVVEIAYKLYLCNCTHRLGYFENNINLGNWYPVLCVYENGAYVADPYYSVGDPFYSDCANYCVQLSYPECYLIGCTGSEKTIIKSGTKTTKMEAKAVRDFAIVLGKNFATRSTKFENTTINYFGYEYDENLDASLETAKRALKTFNELFGEYPYRTLTIAKTPFLFGGMEYPNLVWIADNITDKIEITKVIAHEIAHQWWYGLVGNNEVSHSYIDESLAEYSTVLFFNKNDSYGYSGKQMVQDAATSYELYSEVIDSIKGTVNDTLNQPTTQFSTEYEYVYVVYVKGTLFLDALKDKVGEKAFVSTLKKYCKKFRFKIATRDDFLEMFSKTAGDDISDFFAEWKA